MANRCVVALLDLAPAATACLLPLFMAAPRVTALGRSGSDSLPLGAHAHGALLTATAAVARNFPCDSTAGLPACARRAVLLALQGVPPSGSGSTGARNNM